MAAGEQLVPVPMSLMLRLCTAFIKIQEGLPIGDRTLMEDLDNVLASYDRRTAAYTSSGSG